MRQEKEQREVQLFSAIRNRTIRTRTRTKRSAAFQRNEKRDYSEQKEQEYEKKLAEREVQLFSAIRNGTIRTRRRTKRSAALQRNNKRDYKNKNKEKCSSSAQ